MFIVHCRLNACCKTKETCAFSTCTKKQNRNLVHLHVALVKTNRNLMRYHLCTVSPCKIKYKNIQISALLSYSIMSPYWVRPQNFIHITCHILSSQATGEKNPGMPYPGLACLHTYVTTGKSHGLQEIYPGVSLAFIYLPPP